MPELPPSLPAAPQTSVPSRVLSEVKRYELTIGDYWRIILKRRMVIVASFFMVLIFSIIYTNTKIPVYQTSASVRIASAQRAFQYDGGGGYMTRFMGDPLSNYANAIVSEEVMRRVVVRLNLLPSTAKMADLNEKVNEIRGMITTEPVANTDSIDIIVTHSHPELAAAIANQTAQVFVEVDQLEKSKQSRNLRRFIETQLGVYAQKLQTTEDLLREFRASGRALGVAVGLEQRLSELEKERTLLSKQFTDKHPDVIKLTTEIETVSAKIKDLPEDELELARLQRELEINDRTYRMMKDKYESARMAEAEQVGDVTVTQSASVPDVPISPRKTMNKIAGAGVGLILGVVLALVNENLDTSIGTIEDVEQAVRLPVIGVVPYYNPNREEKPWWRFDQSVFDFLERRKDTPPDGSHLIMNQDSFSTLSEAYRILRTFVEFLMGEKTDRGRLILITSTGPQEGKTLTACNLAIVLAQGGRKTLLVDADLRRPMVHRLFGLKRIPGLADTLMGTIPPDQAKQTMADILVGDNSRWDQVLTSKMLDRLEIIASGTNTPTPAELLNSDAMKNFIEEARNHYDYVILDTPPVLPVTDARTLGKYADATFFIYRAGKTARRALTRAREELNLAGVKVKGIILNQATPEITLTDSYYYQYYGEKRPEKKKPSPKKPGFALPFSKKKK